MCGRVKDADELNEIRRDLRIDDDRVAPFSRRYNIPPTSMVPVVWSAKGKRTLELMKWGLVPRWAEDEEIGYRTFNARAETIAATPAFRGAWKAGHRCLAITGGFYEWRDGDKQPFCIALGNQQPMFMAGLWDPWRPQGKAPVRSFTIITTKANELIAPLHNRMPVIVGAEDVAAWLGEEPKADVAALLKPFPAERLTLWPVDRRIGNVKNEGRELAEPIAI